jgi:hypothetical protein
VWAHGRCGHAQDPRPDIDARYSAGFGDQSSLGAQQSRLAERSFQKKSRSKVSCPRLACKPVKSSSEIPEGLGALSFSKSPAMFSSACCQNWMIWFGCSSNCSESSASVSSPLRAAIATLAQNSAENVRLGRRIIMRLGAWCLHEQRPIINYRPVSKARTSSQRRATAMATIRDTTDTARASHARALVPRASLRAISRSTACHWAVSDFHPARATNSCSILMLLTSAM